MLWPECHDGEGCLSVYLLFPKFPIFRGAHLNIPFVYISFENSFDPLAVSNKTVTGSGEERTKDPAPPVRGLSI